MKIYNSNLITVLAIFITLLGSPVVFSDDGVKTEAKNRIRGAAVLLDSMGMEALMDGVLEQQIDMQVQADPSLKPFKHILTEFLQKHMSYKVLRPEFIKMYAAAFTASELEDLNGFYATPTGKKAISTLPELTAKGAALGQKQITDNISELQQMIMDEVAKNPELLKN